MKLIDFQNLFAEFQPKDFRVFYITDLVNAILHKPEFFHQFEETFKTISLSDPDLTQLHELMEFVYDSTNDDVYPTKVHISFKPEATRKDAINAYLDMFDPIKRKEFENKCTSHDFGDLKWRDKPRTDCENMPEHLRFPDWSLPTVNVHDWLEEQLIDDIDKELE